MRRAFVLFLFFSGFLLNERSEACTNILVTKGASADGSTFITYAADAGGFFEPLYFLPARDWGANDSLDVYEWDTGRFLGRIKQVPHTYKVIGNMNEHQVSVGETTFTGRDGLKDSNAVVDYGSLMYLALQRSKTAREAIQVMTSLVAEYGYASTGESFSVADANEVWILEMISKGTAKYNAKTTKVKGPRHTGAVWVAVRIPDGYMSAHANQSRIRTFDMNDKENVMYSADVVSFAESMGFYDKKSGKAFSFADAYNPLDPGGALYCEGRVWSVFNRAAPSMKLSPDYWRAVRNAEPYPLYIKPDNKLSVGDLMALMRDHFEGTQWDMTREAAAGPFGNPYRWKPLEFQIEGDTTTVYGWGRPISTQQTAFSFVAQARSAMPDAIGGVFWYGLDDTYATTYMPLYAGMTDIPKAYTIAHVNHFRWDSPAWVFNLLNNYSYSKYSYIIKEIQVVQKELESRFIALQPAVESTAKELYKSSPDLAVLYLTDYSVGQANMVFQRYKDLAEYVFTKYNDGYINDGSEHGRHPRGVGYGNEWFKYFIKDNPSKYKSDWKDKLE